MARFLLLAVFASKALAQIRYGQCLTAIYAFQDDPLVYGANTYTASVYRTLYDSEDNAQSVKAHLDREAAGEAADLAQYRRHVRCVVGGTIPAGAERAGVDRSAINLAVNPFQCCDYSNDDDQDLITCNTCATLPVPATCSDESSTGIEFCGGAACPTCVPEIEKDTEDNEYVEDASGVEIRCKRDSYSYEIRPQGEAVADEGLTVRATPTHDLTGSGDSPISSGTCVVSPACQATEADPTGAKDPEGLPWCFSKEDPSKWGYCVKTCETEEAKLLTEPVIIFILVLVLIALFVVVSFCEQKKTKNDKGRNQGGVNAFDNIGGSSNAEFAAAMPAGGAPLGLSPANGADSTSIMVD